VVDGVLRLRRVAGWTGWRGGRALQGELPGRQYPSLFLTDDVWKGGAIIYELTKSFKFEAAHRLPNHPGVCGRLHGHSFTLSVTVAASELAKTGAEAGMVMDLHTLRDRVRVLLETKLDHHYLNDSLKMRSPTVENVARYVFDWLCANGVKRVERVTVQETATSQASYTREADADAPAPERAPLATCPTDFEGL
jgi:6-pyruvoyltetrahydropterin/6-carboxytetrahydropterin synthase